MTLNALSVINYLKEHYGTEYTKAQLAEELHLSIPAITGSVNYLVKRKFCDERVVTYEARPATDTRKALIKTIRYLQLNEAGLGYDPIAEETEKQAQKQAERAAKAAEKQNNN